MSNNLVLISVIGVLVGSSALYVAYKSMRPGRNSGRNSVRIDSNDLLNDLDLSSHNRRSSSSSRSNSDSWGGRKSNHKTRRKK